MKRKLAFASLLVLASCGPSREALQALDSMKIAQDSQAPGITYKTLSGWGNDLTLNDVQLIAPNSMMAAMMGGDDAEAGEDAADAASPPPNPESGAPVAVLNARSMTLKGLTMKDGKPLARDIVVSDMTPAMPTGPVSVSLGTFGFEGMNEVTGKYIAGLFGMDEANPTPALEQWAFSKAALGGLNFTAAIPAEGEDGQGGKVAVTLAEVSFSDLAEAKLGRARFDGLKGDLNIPGMPAVIGTFDFGTLDLSGINTQLLLDPIVAGVMSELDPETPVDYAAMYRNFTSPIDGGIDRTDWTGMKVDMSGLKFDTSAMHAAVKRNADGVAIESTLPRTTMTFTADASGGTLGAMGLMALAMTGYDSNAIELFVAGDATFDPAKDLTRWSNYNVGVTDLFAVEMSGGILGLKQAFPSLMAGIMSLSDMASEMVAEEDLPVVTEDEPEEGEEPAGGEDAPEADGEVEMPDEVVPDAGGGDMFGGADPAMVMQLVMGLLPLQLTDIDIAITDQKLVSLILDRQAIAAGQSLEDYRADLVTMISASSVFLTDAGVDPAIAQELTVAASGFLSGPGTLRIQLAPKSPLGVMSAMAMPMTKESLGFSASFTPAAPAAPAVN